MSQAPPLINTISPDVPDRLLDTKQVAEILRCSPETLEIYRWKGVGLRFVRLGRAVRYRQSDVLAYMERLGSFQSTTEADQADGKEAA